MNAITPKTTILIPFYNTSTHFWQAAIHSMEAQTTRDFKVLVVDDGSDMINPGILLQQSTLDWELIRINSNAGIEEALNTGIQHVSTPYFSRFDSDDIMLPNRIKTEYDAITANPEAIVIASAAKTNTGVILPKQSDYNFHIRFGCPFVHPASCFRIDSIPFPLYERVVIGSEDWIMWKKIIENGLHIVSIPEPTIFYRIHENNTSIGLNDSNKDVRYRSVARQVFSLQEKDVEDFLISTGKFKAASIWSFLRALRFCRKIASIEQTPKKVYREKAMELLCIYADHSPLSAMIISAFFQDLVSTRYAMVKLIKRIS